jgi:hypothetical protein
VIEGEFSPASVVRRRVNGSMRSDIRYALALTGFDSMMVIALVGQSVCKGSCKLRLIFWKSKRIVSGVRGTMTSYLQIGRLYRDGCASEEREKAATSI